ncbi:MAG: acyl-CoA carboxylase subunit beta [Acidimicrobiales bacterium]|jgi:propionyl-CoA carboxylase beta chain
MMSSSPEHNGRSGHSGGLAADAGSPATTAAKLAGLLERRRVLDQQAAASADRQHGHHKLTARERVERLVDPGTFRELDAMARTESTPGDDGTSRAYGDGVVTGLAEVNGRQVCLFSQDFTVFGGSLGRVFGQKVVKAMDVALEIGCPFIGINDSGGARIQEGVTSLALYGDIFYRNVLASGVIPQISIVAGPCAGGAVYSPAITDFTVMVDQLAHMFITGPDVIKTVTGEDVTFEGLGGAATHASKSGVAHYAARDEDDAFDYVRAILGYLPQNHLADPPRWPSSASPVATADDERLNTVVPDSDMSSYDMNNVISAIVDDGDFLEVHAAFAPNIICGFARVDGASVGLVANQPAHLAGTLDIDASEKAARFVRTCDAFNVPVVTLVDVPGFLPGIDQEWQGIIRRGSKLIYAYAEATVPKVTVITRKAYGGAYVVMGSKHLKADVNLAWPTAEIAVMGAEGAVSVVHHRELEAATAAGTIAAVRSKLVKEYHDVYDNPYLAAEQGYIDAVILPSETRLEVSKALAALSSKRPPLSTRKHGNIPL